LRVPDLKANRHIECVPHGVHPLPPRKTQANKVVSDLKGSRHFDGGAKPRVFAELGGINQLDG